MRLTKAIALEMVRDLWTWLAENPTASKSEWPGWEKYSYLGEAYPPYCPCCTYAIYRDSVNKTKLGCNRCPRLEFYSSFSKEEAIEELDLRFEGPCTLPNSPFVIFKSLVNLYKRQYEDTDEGVCLLELASKEAMMLADTAAEQLYEELDEENEEDEEEG